MDVVIRTTHGEAEVTRRRARPDVTLGDLVERTTGRPAPTLVFVDGRAVPAVTPLEIAALLNGTVVDVEPPDDAGADRASVALITVAGTAAGRPGPWRLGATTSAPAARSTSTSSPPAPSTRCGSPSTSALTARSKWPPRAPASTERRSRAATPWRSGVLTVADRAFELRP